MRQLSLVIIFSLVLSITSPIYAANEAQERLSIPKLSFVEIFAEFLDTLLIGDFSFAKQANSESTAEQSEESSENSDDTTESATEEEDTTGFSPYPEPNG